MSGEIYDSRAREIADTTRRYLIALNTGGVAMMFAVASSLATEGVNPGWAIWPVGIFVIGLTISAISLFLAKNKALRRKNAAAEGKPMPDYATWYSANFSYEILTLAIFLVGVFVGLWKLSTICV